MCYAKYMRDMRGKGFTAHLLSQEAEGFSPRGFTLVELLVTISILAVLMTIALVSYDNLQRGARDTRRKSDLSGIQAALEQYHADQGYYPSSITSGSPLTSGTKTYMVKIPQETQSGHPAYSYTAKPSTPTACNNMAIYCTNYCLYATVENNSNATTPTLTQCAGVATSTYQTQAP